MAKKGLILVLRYVFNIYIWIIDKISLKRQNIGSIWYIHSIHFTFSRRILHKVPQSVVFEQNFHKPFVELSFGNFKLNIAELQKLNTATYFMYVYFLVFQDLPRFTLFFYSHEIKKKCAEITFSVLPWDLLNVDRRLLICWNVKERP